jgi:hypothetical protein
VVANPPNLSVVNPKYLGRASSGSTTGIFESTLIVAIPTPADAKPTTLTLAPTKSKIVMELATPTTVPSSFTVNPRGRVSRGTQNLSPG